MRFALLLLLLLAPLPAPAFTAEELQREFDARWLTDQEKRFLQAGLAFAGVYNGMIDGAWGPGSQRALERFTVAEGGTELVTNADAVFAAMEAFTAVDKEGWERQYNADLDLSFLVPTKGLVEGGGSDVFLNFDVRNRTIGYSLTVQAPGGTVRLHQFTEDSSVVEVYTVRRPTVWITSGRGADGTSLYTRSDYRRGAWSTIMLSGKDRDAGAFAAITGSIAPGYAPAIGVSQGKLVDGITTLAAMLETPAVDPNPGSQVTQAPEVTPAVGYGTGFLVTTNGDVLTNRHVIANCVRLSIDGQAAQVIAEDKVFDLALLRAEGLTGLAPATFAQDPARLNSDVTVAGYPLPDLLGGLNITRGSVTSLKGIGGDGINMQISAPVQPGNSGGPVINAAGQVVGVVVAKLDAALALKEYNDIPQNVNFAIRGEIAKLFLAQNGVDPIVLPAGGPLPPEDLAELAQGFTRLVTCN
jgi:S1-C subfamily serine protease